jgi:hypothetical protein
MEKLTQDSLDKLRAAHSSYQNLRSEMADISLHEMMVAERKQEVKEAINAAKAELIGIEAELKEEYQAKAINLATGEVEK